MAKAHAKSRAVSRKKEGGVAFRLVEKKRKTKAAGALVVADVPNGPAITADRWLSVIEIAAYLGVSRETLYRWLEKKKIPANRVGKLWKFRTAEIDEWIKEGGAGN